MVASIRDTLVRLVDILYAGCRSYGFDSMELGGLVHVPRSRYVKPCKRERERVPWTRFVGCGFGSWDSGSLATKRRSDARLCVTGSILGCEE